MPRSFRLAAFVVVLGGGSTVAPPASTQPPAPPAQAAGTRRTPQFENESVRVWKSVIAPGQPLSLHRHERGRVIVALQGGTLRIVEESGESRTVTWETGKAYWLSADPPGDRHGDINEGKAPIEVMVVELVGPTP
jgi:quercetin dioxygenase-like cupin family protein